MKRKAHDRNIPPNPRPRIEFMILSLRGWKDWGLVLGFLGLNLGGRLSSFIGGENIRFCVSLRQLETVFQYWGYLGLSSFFD